MYVKDCQRYKCVMYVKDCQRYMCLDPPVFVTHVVSKTKQARSRHGNGNVRRQCETAM